MIKLTDRQTCAMALNFGVYPVLEIDLSKCDEYGLKGSVCRIDMGEYSDGSKFYERAELRVYGDNKMLTFSSHGCGLTKDFIYSNFLDNVETAMSPIIKPDSEFAVVVHDSKARVAFAMYIVKTGQVRRHCQTPITVEPVDMAEYVFLAKEKYKIKYV